jgi:hypothetical protein
MFIFTNELQTIFIMKKCQFLHEINWDQLTTESHETFLARLPSFWRKGTWVKHSTLKFKQYPATYVVIH